MALIVSADEASDMSQSQWTIELLNAKYGDRLSDGRVLSFGSPADRRAEVEKWGTAPLPTRTKDYHNHHLNSDTWDAVDLRDGDIVIGTCIKAGTTWTQTIIANLLIDGQ